MADIWDRVNEAIDTDPLRLRDIVGELLARAEHAEEGAQLSSDRLSGVRAERDVLRARLTGAAIHADRLQGRIAPGSDAWAVLGELRAALGGGQ